MSLLYRTPPDLCGSYRHRPIGRPWHASRSKNSSLAKAISMSTRNTLPLPHPEPIRSPLPLTIRGFCLCLATLKPYLILAGRSRPRHGQPCSGGSTRWTRCVPSRMGTRVSYEAVRRLLRAARRRQVAPVSLSTHLARTPCAALVWAGSGRSRSVVCSRSIFTGQVYHSRADPSRGAPG